MRNVLARIAGRAVERPTPVIVAAVLLALIGAVAALRLEADRSPDPLVDRGSATYAATQNFYDQFGDEPVEVLVKGDLRQLLLTDNLGRLLALEGCLSGNAPGGKVFSGQPAPPACAAIAELDPSAVVFGPATFLNQFAIQAHKLLGAGGAGGAAQAQQAGAAGGRAGRRRAASRSPRSSQAAAAAGQQVARPVRAAAPEPRGPVRADRHAAARRPAASSARSSSTPAPRMQPKARLRRSSPAPTRR